MARQWSATFPGELRDTFVTVSMAEDIANAHESACAIAVTGLVTERGEHVAEATVRIVLDVGMLRALAATIAGWPGVSRG